MTPVEVYHEYFEICPESPSGILWKKIPKLSRKQIGEVAGLLSTWGYYTVYLLGGWHRTNRVVWNMHHADIPKGMLIDHIDGNKTNNKIENLRMVAPYINSRNAAKPKDCTSGFTGVRFTSSCLSGIEYQYWRATWKCHKTGKRLSKSFRIDIHGDEEAFKLACEARANAIQEMNKDGAGYSERHGQDIFKGD